ncbi:MAG: helix-turn-helix domain-containing protein, partial [Acetobacterales bacterium]
MSVHVMAQVWRLRLGTNRKMVLLKLADHANDDGENAYPSIASLAEHCGVAERSVRRFLRGFEEAGVLERQGDGKGGRGKTTCYRLRIGIAQRAYGTIARGGKGGAGESAGDDGAGESGAGEGGAGEGGAAVENAVNPDRVTAFSDAGGAEKGDRLSAFGDRKGDSSDRKGDSGDHKPGQAVSAEPSRTIQNRPFAPASAREAPGAPP